MPNFETLNTITSPSLDGLENKAGEKIHEAKELLVEGIPQMEHFTEKNPEAITAFLKKYINTEKV